MCDSTEHLARTAGLPVFKSRSSRRKTTGPLEANNRINTSNESLTYAQTLSTEMAQTPGTAYSVTPGVEMTPNPSGTAYVATAPEPEITAMQQTSKEEAEKPCIEPQTYKNIVIGSMVLGY